MISIAASTDNLIVPGLLIKTRFSRRSGWISNIVESVKNDTLCIPLVEEYFSEELLIDGIITIEFVDSEHQYIIDGQVSSIDIVENQTMTVKINNFSTYKNKRKSVRYYTSLGASINSPLSTNGSVAIVTNVSATGICFVSKDLFNMNDRLNLFVLSSINHMVKFTGQIVRAKPCDSWNEYAIEFESSAEALKNIHEIIKNIEQETIELRDTLYKKFNIYLKRTSKSFFNVNILLLENSSLVRMIVKNAINNAGITNITEASNAKEAVEAIKAHRPDIVCLSSMAWEVENNNIFEDIHNINPNIKIFILSSGLERDIDKEIMLKYNIDFIPKSFSCDELIDAIKNYWR